MVNRMNLLYFVTKLFYESPALDLLLDHISRGCECDLHLDLLKAVIFTASHQTFAGEVGGA